MTDAKTIIEPWLNGDPCEGCDDCAKMCRKLQARIDEALAVKDRLITELRKSLDLTETALRAANAEIERLARLLVETGDERDTYDQRAQELRDENERLRAAFRVNMMRYFGKSHAEIDAEIAAAIATPAQEPADE